MFKSSVNRPNKVLIEQYNIQTEDETANKSKIKLKAQRSSKTRKNLAQSKGGKSSKPKDSGSTRMNLESSHQAAFSVSLSSSQSTRSANDNDDDTRATKEASQTFGGKELKTENETKDKQIDVHKYTAEYSSNDAIPKEGKMKGNARKEAMTKEKAAKDRQIAKVRAEEKEENATEKAVKEEKLVVLESEEGQEEQSKRKETEDDAYDVEHAGETDPFLATKGSNVQVNPATRSQNTPNTIIIMSELASHPDTSEAASEDQDVRNTEGTQNQMLQEVDKVNSPVQTKPNEDKESNRKAANGRGCTVS